MSVFMGSVQIESAFFFLLVIVKGNVVKIISERYRRILKCDQKLK